MIYSKTSNYSKIFLVLAIFSFVIFYMLEMASNKRHSITYEYNKLSEQIDTQSDKLLLIGDEIHRIILKDESNYWKSLDSLFHRNKYFCFVTIQDSLIYWNSNKIGNNDLKNLQPDNKIHVIKLPSGWYIYLKQNTSDLSIAVLELIKSDYILNNELLTPGFGINYTHGSNLELTLDENLSSNKIYNSDEEFILGTLDNSEQQNDNSNYLILFFYFLSYTFLLFSILNKFLNLKTENRILNFTLFILTILILRTLDILSDLPHQLKSSSYFATNLFDIPLSNSQADLLTNTIILIIISIASAKMLSKKVIINTPFKIILKYSILWIYIIINLFFLHHTILDRQIYFFSEGIFHNYTLFLSLLVVLGLNISLFFTFITFLNSAIHKKIPILIPIFIIFIGLTTLYITSNIPITIILITFSITITLIVIRHYVWKYITDNFLIHLFILVLLSVISSIVISNSYNQKNDNYQKFIGNTLAISRDSIFETNYIQINNSIVNDDKLRNKIFNDSINDDKSVEDYIITKYFNSTLKKYNIQVTYCGDNELIEIQPEKEVRLCVNYFNQLIDEFTEPIKDSSLFKFNSTAESIYYISRISITDPLDSLTKRILFIEFVSSHIPEGFGYPELLIDTQSSSLNLTDYSFAFYSEKQLQYKFGDFPYNTYLKTDLNFKHNLFLNYDNYRHYAIQISPNKFLIISRGITPTTLKIVVFSIIFLFLAFISLIVYLIIYSKMAFSIFRQNFKARLQTFIITTLTITFILTGVTTIIYIKNSNQIALEKQLTEKTNSVLIELQHKLSSVTDLQKEDKDILHQLLRKFSLVFFSDINLYDISGELIATSRPEIFEKKLLSTYINPAAYNAIFHENKLNYITEENIGSLSYFSAFVPINLNNDSPIGIVNLPYFARQTQITKSYYIMLSYLLNIYVIIGIFGALLAIIFSKYLTKPLVLLQESLAALNIDKHNEKIYWNKNDEIGQLINEYNLMVDKLEQSTELLKHSERESAWREVARQIAHEIKNPLTPMKLNVQYLERAYKNNDPQFDSKMSSISKSLITQIDVLDDVAEMFSDFAKSKSLNLKKVNLKDQILSSVNLFNKNSNVKITIEYEDTSTKLITLGFEKDILRVINNLIKNAIQSVEKDKIAIIKINITSDIKFITVSISDNGKGITKEMKPKIFKPYFTTKTSGTGLGLAIVRNIMTEIGGSVNFENRYNEIGTTFILKFPNAYK